MGDEQIVQGLALDQEVISRGREARTHSARHPRQGQGRAGHECAQQDGWRLVHGASIRGKLVEQDAEVRTQRAVAAHPGGGVGHDEGAAEATLRFDIGQGIAAGAVVLGVLLHQSGPQGS